MSTRISRYGTWNGSAAENISYGSDTPRDVVISLLVDDGVPSRGHRTNILAAGSRFAGVGCGRHTQYGTMCVIDYAGGYQEAGAAAPAAAAAPVAPAAATAPAATTPSRSGGPTRDRRTKLSKDRDGFPL
jgi:hypothetical protein